MELWVALSLGAAFLQNLRTALQKALTPRVGVLGATYARFLFAAPWAVLLVAALVAGGTALPRPTAAFALWALGGAVAQIAGTLLLLHLFSFRNFAAGNTYARTETVQAAFFGLVLLGDALTPLALAGIVVSFVGLVMLSATRGLGTGALNRAAAIGLASGGAFALAGIGYRAAALALPDAGHFLMRPACTLAYVTVAQSVLLTAWLRLRGEGGIGAVLREWRIESVVGASGMLASLCWFAAFTLAAVAEVKAVGQAELLLNWLTARFAFGERPSARETLGMALVAAGIVAVIRSGSG
jgi:drug/metabolite transporter (DMT)-like permease